MGTPPPLAPPGYCHHCTCATVHTDQWCPQHSLCGRGIRPCTACGTPGYPEPTGWTPPTVQDEHARMEEHGLVPLWP